MEMRRGFSRRRFIGGSIGAALGAALLPGGGARAAEPEAPSIRLGGPMFGAPADPVELAKAHRALGYRAAYCPDVSLADPGRIRAVEEAFRDQGVAIAEVGRWCNLLDADPAKRQANLKTVTEGLALADAVGALCCVDIAGSFSDKEWFGPHPKNVSKEFFDAAVENARKIIDAVKPKRSRFCYEMMGWALPDSPESCLKLIQAVDREAFGAHLDPANLVNSPGRFWGSGALLEECFDRLGKWIVSCHAKDLVWDVEMNIHFREVRPGAGSLDYATFLKRLSRLPHRPPLMVEHLPNKEEYDRAREFLQKECARLGIST